MWMVGEWLSAMATCMRVVLILVLCAETGCLARQTPPATLILQRKKGGMWIEGECLSGMATLMRVILILLLYMFVGEH